LSSEDLKKIGVSDHLIKPYTFEKLIYGVKDATGSYTEMLGMYSIANGYDKQIEALRYKNSILRSLLGVS